MREPARRQRSDRICLFLSEHTGGLRHQCSVFELERMADDNARIELGRIDTLFTELTRETPARRLDGKPCKCFGLGEHRRGRPHAGVLALC